MRTRLRRSLKQVSLGLAAVLLVAVGVVAGATVSARTASANSATTGLYHAQEVVNTYLGILNSGMSSGTCDFSAMSSVYAPAARVTATGGPFGPGGSFGEQQFDGITNIIGFYTKLCHVVSHLGVVQWTQDAAFLLAPNVLNSYEHTSVSGTFLGRCMHVFTISGDRIQSLDWSVYA